MSEFIPGDFWEKRLNQHSGLEGVGYEKLGRPFNIWAYRIRKAAFLNLLETQSVDPRGKRVLDIGSGTGFYLDIWKQLGASPVFGADITEVAVQNLQKRFPDCTVVRLDIGEPLPDNHPWLGTFDMISCMDVLFHIVDDNRFQQAHKNIFKLLKPGGKFIYSDNFLKGETVRTRHQVCHTNAFLSNLFREVGFVEKARKPFMYFSNFPIDSSSKLLRWHWLAFENALALIKPLGHLAGPVLFRIDRALIRTKADGPTTKIVLLEKP